MHILYVSQYFPPEMGAPAARVYELSRHWVRSGHMVTVLTGFPNHPTGVVPTEYRHKLRRLTVREDVDGINVVRTWLYPAPNRYPPERIANYTSFFVSACVRGIFLERPDIVIATSPQLLVGACGWWLSRLWGSPFVFEVRDLWPESLLASGIGRSESLLIRSLDGIASFLYRRAHCIVVVSEAFKTRLVAERGVPESKIAVIENGVDPEEFRPREDAGEVRRRLGLEGRFVVSYIGTLGYAHRLGSVLEAAARLSALAPDVMFLLVGEGAEKEKLREAAAQRGLTNVKFVDQRPRKEVPVYISASDVCLVLLKDAELFTTVLPSKMFEFMACERPVVLGVNGHAREVLDRAHAGVYVPPEDPDALMQAVLALRRDATLRSRLGQNGRQFVLCHYSRGEKASAYLRALESLKGSSSIMSGTGE